MTLIRTVTCIRDRRVVVLPKAVGIKKRGWFKVFPERQDHLGQGQGQVQRQRQPGVGREQGQPEGLISGQKMFQLKLLGIKTGYV